VAFSLDRATLVEGIYDATLTVAGSVPQVLGLRAVVNKAPEIVILRAIPQSLSACDGGSIDVAARITDDSTVASATISWIGPGTSGVAAMGGGAEWMGIIAPQPIAGTWAYAIQAIDERGNAGSAVGTFQITPC
jgi:hypothetical protein